jgi:hypothetical protein
MKPSLEPTQVAETRHGHACMQAQLIVILIVIVYRGDLILYRGDLSHQN